MARGGAWSLSCIAAVLAAAVACSGEDRHFERSTAVGGSAGDPESHRGGAGAASSAGAGGRAVASGGSGTVGQGGASGQDGNSAGSAGVPTGPEDCSNGRDDDADGDVDCADAECVERLCVPTAPDGWSGPAHLFEGDPAEAPGCTGEMESQVLSGGTEPLQQALSCSVCGCSAVGALPGTEPACELPGQSYSGGPSGACASSSGSFVFTSTCLATPTSAGYTLGALRAIGGSCTPSGGEVSSRPAPTWEVTARACARPTPATQGCETGRVCLPAPEPPFLDSLCITRAGDHTCPAEYPDRRAYPSELDDQRSCTSCACGAPTGVRCSVTLAGYSQTNCTGTRSEVTRSAGFCQSFSGQRGLRLEHPSYSGACAPTTTSTSTGSVQATGLVTVCCASASSDGF